MKFLTTFLVLCFLSGNSFAATGFKDLFQNYQYAVTVEWDQHDKDFLEAEEQKFSKGIEILLQSGHSTQDIVNDSLTMIHDENLRNEIKEALSLYGDNKISKDQLLNMLEQNASAMSQQGSSWSTLGKIVVGVVVTYAVLKILQVIIINATSDEGYGGGTTGPWK